MRIEPGLCREKRAGGVIFEPMGREKAPGGAAPEKPAGEAERLPGGG